MIPPPSNKSPSTVLSPAQTLVDGRAPVLQRYSPARRYVLLLIFCLAQFLDAFNNSALFSAIPALVRDLGMTEAESTWIISAFQLTFASFLLISGRISDVYNPKLAFIGGVAGLGVLSIGAGFVTSKIPLIVIRALSGISASLTIPSALTLLVHVFPEPTEQARAIGVFGGCGAVGNVLGLVVGAIFVQFASWSWVFWFVALVCMPISVACVFLVPAQEPHLEEVGAKTYARWRSLDLGGVSILTVALILFIYGVTSGTTSGWGSAGVLVPLILAVLFVIGFFWFETRIPTAIAAIPPSTWFLPNFLVLFFTALLPYFWWTTIFTIYTTLWQDVWGWSAISTAIHMIPLGVLAFAMSFTGALSRLVSPKYIILAGEALCLAATALLVFADRPARYWPLIFPAFVAGSAGAMLTYTHTNIALFRASPPRMAGTVGAIFNGALQLGSAIGISAVGSIESSVEKTSAGGAEGYAGRAAAYWFLFAVVALEWIAMLVFYRTSREGAVEEEVEVVQEKAFDVEEVVSEEKKVVVEEVAEQNAADSVAAQEDGPTVPVAALRRSLEA